MMRTLKPGDQIGSAWLREDASQANSQRAGRPALEILYCGEIFAACIPFGPRFVS
jgi:hypothetical protein